MQLSTLVNDARRAMVCTANDLLEWKDFPKGLRVLLLDENRDSANEIRAKLEEMDYIVSVYLSESEALSAISNKTHHNFHVAMVEVNLHNSDGRYKFLETAKDLPTIMTSNEHRLSTMMKCIALGAVEFLVKPLSEEKLRNIWQHVVRETFNAGGNEASGTPKSIKEFLGSILETQHQNTAVEDQVLGEPKPSSPMSQNDHDHDPSTNGDKFPARSTPQLKHGGRFLDDGDCQEQPHVSPIIKSGQLDGETKFVDTTTGDSVAKMEVDPPQPTANVAVKEEDYSMGSKGLNNSSPKPHDKVDTADLDANNGNSNKESAPENLCGAKGNKKKAKVDWASGLHKKFVQAVEQLGVDQAIPSKILELMKVEGLTRHNVASHLQKYRMQRRHILPKEENRRWPRNIYPHQPVMAFPPYQTHPTFAPGQVYPIWEPQGGRPPGCPIWGPASYPSWQPIENWQRNPYSGMQACTWGCPVLPPPLSPSLVFPQVQSSYGFQSPDHFGKNSLDLNPGEEVIDKVVKEVMSKPWLPLPIGLKPPSIDGVLAELSRQGISIVPPHSNGRHHC